MESYTGAVQTPKDAILLLEAARTGLIPRVKRRLKDKERKHIKAGDVFIWLESEAKMRRWTDGRSWSASRVTGTFLTYREMESSPSAEGDRSNNNYRYKQDGLIKQSFSITTSTGEKLHLISYTITKDFSQSKLSNKTPSTDPAFADIVIPQEMYPQFATLMTATARTIISSQTKPRKPRSPSPLRSTPVTPPQSTHESPLASPQHSPSSYPTTSTEVIPRSVMGIQGMLLPPLTSLLPQYTPLPTRPSVSLHENDAMALRHLDRMFK